MLPLLLPLLLPVAQRGVEPKARDASACSRLMQFGETPRDYLSTLQKESEAYARSRKFRNKVDELWGRKKVAWHKGRIGEIAGDLKKLINPSARSILDLGAGPGMFAAFAWRRATNKAPNSEAQRAVRVVGVELTPGWVRAGREYVAAKGINVSMVHGDVTNISVGGAFDLVYMADAIEHVPFYRRGALWSTIAKHSMPGTRLYLHFPNVARQRLEAQSPDRQAF